MISTDEIFENIFNNSKASDQDVLQDFDSVDSIFLKNYTTNAKKIIQSHDNFQHLIRAMTMKETKPVNNLKCRNGHSSTIIPHDWYVQGNCFVVMVKPFIEKRHYELIKDQIDFEKYYNSNRSNYGGKSCTAGEFVYWPNITVSYFGWRQYLLMKFDIDIGNYVPLVHNRRLGNVNLFEFYPKFFLNIELSMTCNGKKLFVNGRTQFTEDHDDLFIITLTDGSVGTCKVHSDLVFSNKNLFDYIRDDINLESCITADKYKHVIRVDLQSLRVFKGMQKHDKGYVPIDKLKINYNITASSEFHDIIVQHVSKCLDSLNEFMVSVLQQHEIADGNVLKSYLVKSNYINFDYIIIVLWRLLMKNQDFEYGETDIRLLLEVVCESLFRNNTKEWQIVNQRCEPYFKLLPKVFIRFCNHWTLFLEENPLESLANYFAIHYMIYLKQSASNPVEEECWDYTYENAINCGASAEVLCKGFLKKIQSANACLVFNGKHYVAVKKDDDLFKLTDKINGIVLSSVKFNNWKYLYFTEEGVYNLFINGYHSSTPFILGNTLVGALTKKNETTYLPESALQFMLDNSKYEREIFKIYHMAKVCRDIKNIKSNMNILLAFNNCFRCKHKQQFIFNDLFKEIWDYSHNELIVLGVYLNEKKMSDLIMNLKCASCQMSATYKKCACYYDIKVDVRAFKIVIMFELFCNYKPLIELVWCLLYSSSLYSKVLLANVSTTKLEKLPSSQFIIKYIEFFHEHRMKIITLLYSRFDKIDFIDTLVDQMRQPLNFIEQIQHDVQDESNFVDILGYGDDINDSSNVDDNNKNVNDDSQTDDVDDEAENDNTESKLMMIVNKESDNKHYMTTFYIDYCNTLAFLKNWNIWWDKLVVARYNDDLSSWLVRFYMRIFMTKLNLKDFSSSFVKKIVTGYLYYANFTNFNPVNSLLMMHFDASLGIPSDYEKCCVYLNGEPGSGKSSNFELMEQIVVVHKHDAENYTLSRKETDEMEANKLISQLYVINEMKECNDSFFKSTADSTKSNAVCRKYQGSQKYEGNYKLMIVNNKPLYISNYDKGVRNRFAIVYTDHVFEENLPFSGSVYSHIKTKRYPMEKTYYEGLVTPVRLFLSHILMYKRNSKDGYVSYKNIVKNDPVHNHNLMCLDINNSLMNALIYVLKVRVKYGVTMVDESKIDKMIELSMPHVDVLVHNMLKSKRGQSHVAQMCAEFRRRYKKYYRPEQKIFYNIDMAWDKRDFNLNTPTFKC